MNEQAIDVKTRRVVVKVDPQYFRPAEVECVSIHTSFVMMFDRDNPLVSSSEILPRLNVFLAGSARSISIPSSRKWYRRT